jgi:hypothetical protein
MQLEEVCQHALGLLGFRMTQVKVCDSHDSSSPKMPSASASMMSKAAFSHLVLLKLLAIFTRTGSLYPSLLSSAFPWTCRHFT